ncbi:MAG: hypothetical protein ACFB2X_01390 [Rivularia sp. (in: cyanobacteria)]
MDNQIIKIFGSRTGEFNMALPDESWSYSAIYEMLIKSREQADFLIKFISLQEESSLKIDKKIYDECSEQISNYTAIMNLLNYVPALYRD